MRRQDFALPWGREDEVNLVSIQLNAKSLQSHKNAVSVASAMIDTSAPHSLSSVGQDRWGAGKKAQNRRDRQREINDDNRKMVERMAHTLRHGGPTVHGTYASQPYIKQERGAALINLQRRNTKIEAENKRIRERLRPANVKPIISAKAHAQHYAKASAVRSNISMALRREMRSHKFRRERAKSQKIPADELPEYQTCEGTVHWGGTTTISVGGGVDDISAPEASENPRSSSAPQNTGSSPAAAAAATNHNADGSSSTPSTATVGLTALRTARDVRNVIATERGEGLPAWLMSDRMPYQHIKRQNAAQQQKRQREAIPHAQNSHRSEGGLLVENSSYFVAGGKLVMGAGNGKGRGAKKGPTDEYGPEAEPWAVRTSVNSSSSIGMRVPLRSKEETAAPNLAMQKKTSKLASSATEQRMTMVISHCGSSRQGLSHGAPVQTTESATKK